MKITKNTQLTALLRFVTPKRVRLLLSAVVLRRHTINQLSLKGKTNCLNCFFEFTANTTDQRVTLFNHSNLSGKMVGVIVASIIVCGIFLTVAVLMCRRLKHGPDCNVAHEIGLVVTPVLHPRPRSSASSSSASSHRNVFQLHRKGLGQWAHLTST